ncbi:MAG: MoaD/ThiS family protein [Acidilobaceae archaeon]
MALLRVYALLREKLGWSSKTLALGREARLRDVLESVDELKPLVSLFESGELIVLVNGVNARLLQGLDTPVRDEDVLDIFPPGGGGL